MVRLSLRTECGETSRNEPEDSGRTVRLCRRYSRENRRRRRNKSRLRQPHDVVPVYNSEEEIQSQGCNIYHWHSLSPSVEYRKGNALASPYFSDLLKPYFVASKSRSRELGRSVSLECDQRKQHGTPIINRLHSDNSYIPASPLLSHIPRHEPQLTMTTTPSFTKCSWKCVSGRCTVKQYYLEAIFNKLTSAGVTATFECSESSILHFDLMDFAVSTLDSFCYTAAVETNGLYANGPVHTFVFDKGVIVIWGADEINDHTGVAQAVSSLARVASSRICFFLESFSDYHWPSEWCCHYSQNYCLISDLPGDVPVPSTRIKNDRLYLKTGCADELIAASLALGQSCRLHVYEQAVEKAIIKFGKLPLRIASNEFDEHLAYGSSQLLKIRQWVGEIYAMSVNANTVEDFLDVPAYFWDHDMYQPFWKRIHDYLELESRMKILNLRISCLKEVLQLVSRRKVSAQNMYLSWCVIIILAAGVVVTIVKEYLDRAQSKFP